MTFEVKVSDAGLLQEGRGGAGPAFESLPRRKPRTGRALFWLSATYGGLRIACGSGVSAQWRVARSLAGRTDDGGRVRSRGYAGLAQARRSKEHWRLREDIGFLLRGVGGDEGKRHCEAGRMATVDLRRRSPHSWRSSAQKIA